VTQNSRTIEIDLLDGLTQIASRAAAAILAVTATEMNRRDKPDHSPVTAADEASEAVILAGLARLRPEIAVISEEATGHSRPAGLGRQYFLVDPLDGTREFIAGRDEYTVNIALVDGDMPVAGVIAAPARGLIWRGRVGSGAERLALAGGAAQGAALRPEAIRTRARPAVGARVLVSRSHLDTATAGYLARLAQPEQVACGSSLKLCLIAEGSADLYPRLAPTSDWDVAAGHAVLAAAGGAVQRPDGGPVRYGQGDLIIPAFVAYGDRAAPPPRVD
jgi:3'(2'), 5'-bisphosphate nucleotidase